MLGRPLEGVLVAALTLVCAALVLHLWRADLAVPLRYAPVDDTKFYLMLVKGIIEHGGYLSNPSLGAPFGQSLNDYPQGADDLSLLIVRGLALLSSNPALVVNVFFLLTFALASFTSHLVLRSQGVSALVAGVVSVLFSLLPYHFFRGESHLLLSAYYAVPLTAYLFLSVLGEGPLFVRSARPRQALGWASRRSLLTVALCVVIGSDNLYYATFAVVLLIAAALIALVRRRGRAALTGGLVVGLVSVTLVVNLAPTLVYRATRGSNPALERSAAADERSNQALGLRLTNLILPAPGSRIAPLRRLAASYDNTIAPGYCEACYASLGVVGTVGFIWLAICGLGTLVGAAGWYGGRRLFRHAGAGVAIALAVGAIGGLSSLIELLVTPDIRGWSRISVLIAFFSLLAVALALDSLVTWLGKRCRGMTVGIVTLAAVLAFGVFDQTSASFTPDYATVGRQYRSDAAFVAEIQARLPRGAAVFQLPYVPFPEGYPSTPVGDRVSTYATKYEPLRGYLHSSTLSWSYGAIKGRPTDWPAQLAGQPLWLVAASVASAGFDGIWLDPAGFEPARAARVEIALRSLLGVTPLRSPDRDLWFFDLRPYRRGLERSHSPMQLALLRAHTLRPLSVACAGGGLALVNPSPIARPATLAVHLSHDTLRRRVLLAPGRRIERLSVAAMRGRPTLGVPYATLTDAAAAPFRPTARGPDAAIVPGLIGPACPR